MASIIGRISAGNSGMSCRSVEFGQATVLGGKFADELLALDTLGIGDTGLLLDRVNRGEHRRRVPAIEGTLLLLKQAQQAAVLPAVRHADNERYFPKWLS